MAETKVVNLEVKTTVEPLKKQLKEAQKEVEALSEKFGATSLQAINAAKRAGELKDAIGDAKALTDLVHELQRRRSIAKKELFTLRVEPYSL